MSIGHAYLINKFDIRFTERFVKSMRGIIIILLYLTSFRYFGISLQHLLSNDDHRFWFIILLTLSLLLFTFTVLYYLKRIMQLPLIIFLSVEIMFIVTLAFIYAKELILFISFIVGLNLFNVVMIVYLFKDYRGTLMIR